MLFFRRIRKVLRLNQRQMAEACGVSRSTWQMVEYGIILPSPELGQKICELTGLGAVPTQDDSLSAQELRRFHRARPFEFAGHSEDVWARVHDRCSSMTQLYTTIGQHLLAWMESMLECESVPEGVTWLQLAFGGASQVIANPHELGFRGQCIVDRSGKPLGERQLPGLQGQLGSTSYLVWPQVSVRPRSAIIRMDGLLLLTRGCDRHWVDLEIDSALHDPEKDALRRKLLKMDEIRLTQLDVDRFKVVERISERAGNLFRKCA